ncbi:ParB/RepB/Spo0J family partition protein [Candidimonas nitroreducens]|jgi:ParB family chromosome partitioning protein|uniref:Chromosome partitioning protein ParB n=1 Tax=Candidimonas nitroreducens TaxID=683354 RepID=A0A225MWV1_9BURK|nr:ParB/RepB/Spo0J family partition protein [Candidimonas nitroreducens]OWT65552.1 chromosome partitioning protein ParB [Candidimonas nitroreducens]
MTNTIIELDPAKLIVSVRYQARKTPGQQPLPELADSIAAQGLLQNLVVAKAKKRGMYEVVAGGRRLQAIELLRADGRWPEGQRVHALLVEGNSAFEASITENVQREAMHPADEFEAFAALIEQGRSIEDVAARFAVSPLVVKRRMRLAGVASELIDAYRVGEMSLEVLMAFTITDDQQRQRDAWVGLSEWERRNAHIVRNRLAADELTAADGVVHFVGLDAYRAAGGRCYQDLFAQADDGRGTYVQDRTLIETLALDKLGAAAQTVRTEGWAWVDVCIDVDNGLLSRFGRVWPEARHLTEAEQSRLDDLTVQRAAIHEKMDAVADDDDDTEWLDLDQQSDELGAHIENIHDAAKQWPSDMMGVAGAIVTIGFDGIEKIHRGLIRPEHRQGAVQASKGEAGGAGAHVSLPQAKTRPMHSERLVRQLTANKVGIVAAELAAKPGIALAALVASLVRKMMIGGYYGGESFGIGISIQQEALEQNAPDFAQSRAGMELARIQQHWIDLLPKGEHGDTGDVMQWALAQDAATLLDLLAYLVASSVQGIRHQENSASTALDELAAIADVDPARWWEPSAESYLSHVSKGRIIDVVAEGVSKEAAVPLAKMKKAEAVLAAQQALVGRGWLPEILHIRTE